MLDSIFSLNLFATSFTTVLVIQDPLGAIPIFLSLTSRQDTEERKRSAREATLVSLSVILVFAIFGRYILKFLGISVPALQTSGGLLLLLVALESPDPDAVSTNAALVPLGTPLLAGPGAIVSAMVSVESAASPVVGWASVTAAMIATHVVIWLTLRFSVALHRFLGDSAIRVLTRIFGLLLAAIAVEMIAEGVLAYVRTALSTL